MLLNILQCTGQGLPTNNNPAPNVSSDVVENHIVDQLNQNLWGWDKSLSTF